MSVRPILQWPDKRLSMECAPLKAPDPALIEDLFDTMYDAFGRGLAAPQIGVMSRVFVMDTLWKEETSKPQTFINPVILMPGDEFWSEEEQCLSIPDLVLRVTRMEGLVLEWTDENWETRSMSFAGIEARCIQHELDHLNGRTLLDRMTSQQRQAFEARNAD